MKIESFIRFFFHDYKSKREILSMLWQERKLRYVEFEKPIVENLNKKCLVGYQGFPKDVPIEVAQRSIIRKLSGELEPYIEWEVIDRGPFGYDMYGRLKDIEEVQDESN